MKQIKRRLFVFLCLFVYSTCSKYFPNTVTQKDVQVDDLSHVYFMSDPFTAQVCIRTRLSHSITNNYAASLKDS